MTQDFRLKLKATRQKLGLSQSKLSIRLGVPMRTLIAWENNQRKPCLAKMTTLVWKLDAMMSSAEFVPCLKFNL